MELSRSSLQVSCEKKERFCAGFVWEFGCCESAESRVPLLAPLGRQGCKLQAHGDPAAGSSPVAAVLPSASHAAPAHARPPAHPWQQLHLQLSSTSFYMVSSSGSPCPEEPSRSIAFMTGRHSSSADPPLQLILVFSHIFLQKYSHCSHESVA